MSTVVNNNGFKIEGANGWGSIELIDQALIIATGVLLIAMFVWEVVESCTKKNKNKPKLENIDLELASNADTSNLKDQADEPLPVQIRADQIDHLGNVLFNGEEEITDSKICLIDAVVDKHDVFANSLVDYREMYEGMSPEMDSILLAQEPRITKALETLQEIEDTSSDRVLSEYALANFSVVQAKARAVYFHLWFMLWIAKLRRWQTAKQRTNGRQNEFYNSGSWKRRKLAIRAAPFGVFFGIFAFFYWYAVPKRLFLLDFDSGNALAVIMFIVAPIDYILLALVFIFVSLPPRAPNTGELLGGVKDGFCLLIACYNSDRESLQRVIRAAKLRIEPEAVFICDNSDKLQPMKDSTRKLCEQEGINYVYVPEGNKSHAFDWTIRHFLPEHFKFIMMTDDDVEIPANIEIPFQGILADPTVGALAFPIRTTADTKTGKRPLLVAFQDHEYKQAGMIKMLQSEAGGVLCAHGAIALWKRETFLEIMRLHTTVFNGEDLQMGLIINSLRGLHRIKIVNSEFVPTNPPATIRDSEGLKGLYTQRVKSWDVTVHRFFFQFLAFTFTDILPPKERLMIHLCNLANIWTVVQDYIRIPLMGYFLAMSPAIVGWGYFRFFCIQWCFLIAFNFLKLDIHEGLRSPWYVLMLFPLYQSMGLYFRFIALWFNFWSYHDAADQKRRVDLDYIGQREDLHDRPPTQIGLAKIAGGAGHSSRNWELIWRVNELPSLYGAIMDRLEMALEETEVALNEVEAPVEDGGDGNTAQKYAEQPAGYNENRFSSNLLGVPGANRSKRASSAFFADNFRRGSFSAAGYPTGRASMYGSEGIARGPFGLPESQGIVGLLQRENQIRRALEMQSMDRTFTTGATNQGGFAPTPFNPSSRPLGRMSRRQSQRISMSFNQHAGNRASHNMDGLTALSGAHAEWYNKMDNSHRSNSGLPLMN